MADEVRSADADQKTEQAAPAPQAPAQTLVSVYGREFDVSSAEGRAMLKGWSEAHESERGRLANEVGALRKEVEPLRKYNLKGASVDEISLRKQVADLRETGNHLEADNLLFEYNRQIAKAADTRYERERMWSDYRTARKDVFDVLEEDMAKSYIFSNYQKELEEAPDPFSLMDRVLLPKASKRQIVTPPSPPPAVLGAAPTPAPAAQASQKSEPKLSPMAEAMKGFGFPE